MSTHVSLTIRLGAQNRLVVRGRGIEVMTIGYTGEEVEDGWWSDSVCYQETAGPEVPSIEAFVPGPRTSCW